MISWFFLLLLWAGEMMPILIDCIIKWINGSYAYCAIIGGWISSERRRRRRRKSSCNESLLQIARIDLLLLRIPSLWTFHSFLGTHFQLIITWLTANIPPPSYLTLYAARVVCYIDWYWMQVKLRTCTYMWFTRHNGPLGGGMLDHMIGLALNCYE